MAGRASSPRPSYKQDVANPLYREAEERVYAWLVRQGKLVTDNRDRHTFHDFTVGHAWTLDVKCDTQAHATGNVAWEQGVSHKGGAIVDGWGLHHGLNYVVYIMPPEGRGPEPWPLLLCRAEDLRAFVRDHRETAVCKGFMVQGTDRAGFGFLLNIAALRADGRVLQEGEA